MTITEALLKVLPEHFDVFRERYREDDDEPVVYIADAGDLSVDALAEALEAALKE